MPTNGGDQPGIREMNGIGRLEARSPAGSSGAWSSKLLLRGRRVGLGLLLVALALGPRVDRQLAPTGKPDLLVGLLALDQLPDRPAPVVAEAVPGVPALAVAVPPAAAQLDDARVAAGSPLEALRDVVDDLLGDLGVAHDVEDRAEGGETALLPERDQVLRHGAELLGAVDRRHDPAVDEEARDHVPLHRLAMGGRLPELPSLESMSHILFHIPPKFRRSGEAAKADEGGLCRRRGRGSRFLARDALDVGAQDEPELGE